MSVIARSVSAEAISAETKDCFASLAMTTQRNFLPLPFVREGQGEAATHEENKLN